MRDETRLKESNKINLQFPSQRRIHYPQEKFILASRTEVQFDFFDIKIIIIIILKMGA